MTAPRRPRVLLADDHLLVAEALRSLLTPEFDLVGVVEDGHALVEAAGRLRPDVIVADITMPHLNGIDAMAQLRQGGDQVPVVFLTMHRDVTFARRALEAGASGFVLKHSASVELIAALHAALEGKTYLTPQLAGEVLEAMKQGPERAADPIASLTPRQREVLRLLGRGAFCQTDRHEPLDLGAHCGVSQVPDDGDAGPSHQRRADPLRHQERPRRTLSFRLPPRDLVLTQRLAP